MKKIKSLFVDSFHELSNLKTMAMTAMLLAIAVVLGFYTLNLSQFLRINFSFIANELTALLFGPVVGGLMGGIGDVIKYLMNPSGPFFPGLTLSPILAGIIYGMVLYKRPVTVKRIVLANGLVTVFINLLLNTYWLSVLYGNAFVALLPARAAKQIIMLPIEIILFYTVAKILAKGHVFSPIGSKIK